MEIRVNVINPTDDARDAFALRGAGSGQPLPFNERPCGLDPWVPSRNSDCHGTLPAYTRPWPARYAMDSSNRA